MFFFSEVMKARFGSSSSEVHRLFFLNLNYCFILNIFKAYHINRILSVLYFFTFQVLIGCGSCLGAEADFVRIALAFGVTVATMAQSIGEGILSFKTQFT